ncbi:small integral membrane protein 15 [Ixodes scapularis]|nr:small integral membrane protein 15 [Ixodes scapularis]
MRMQLVDVKAWLDTVVRWAAESPGEFIYYVLLGLSPFFLISAFLSWKLAKHLEAEDKRKKQRSKKKANVAETRRTKSD